jgi:hypothetical protein
MTILCGVITMPFVLPREPVRGNSLQRNFCLTRFPIFNVCEAAQCLSVTPEESQNCPMSGSERLSQNQSLKAGHPTSEDVMRQAFLRNQN